MRDDDFEITFYRVYQLKVDGFELQDSVVLSCEYDAGTYYARVVDPKGIALMGNGVTAGDARQDVLEMMCESLVSLQERRHTLSRRLGEELKTLEDILVQKS